MKGDVWREVEGKAVRCNDCPKNYQQVLNGEGNIVGVNYTCEAENGICVNLKEPIAGQEWYEDFHEIYHKEDKKE